MTKSSYNKKSASTEPARSVMKILSNSNRFDLMKLLLNTKLSSEQNDYVLAVQKSGDSMMTLLNAMNFQKMSAFRNQQHLISFRT